MRLVTYDVGHGPRAGVLAGERIVDAWAVLGGTDGRLPTLGTILRDGRLGELAGVDEGGPGVAASEARLLAPVTDPEKIICIGLNYVDHAEEVGVASPDTPTFFPKYRNALAAPGADVPLPPWSSQVDYEAEVAFVVGRRCKDVAEADALDVIAGYTLLNDLSARDYQFLTPQWTPGKVFDGSAPFGPALLTPDEVGDPAAIGIELELNGEIMQSSTTANLVHSIPALVAFLTKLMTLEPGDVVSTGTPAGVGQSRDPQVFLKAGDVTVVASPQLGRLETRLI
jgi:2-keto-4-pentenoate hydratase/2-oxohepta-3-ene-1,7-dioic acid hydratase in catechol pathway